MDGPDPSEWSGHLGAACEQPSALNSNADPDVAPSEAVRGDELVERMQRGLSFPFPLDPSTLFAFEASLAEDENGNVKADPVRAWEARWQRLGQIAALLIEKDPAMFRVLENVALSLLSGATNSMARPVARGRGRPKKPENDYNAITARLRGLKTDDDARKYLRQAVSTCVVGASAEARRQARDAMPDADRETLEEQHRAAYFMLTDELNRLACGLRIPRLTNVFLLLLDERGCERKLLMKAADAADVLKNGDAKRKNLSDHLVATRKDLQDLERLSPGFARFVEEAAWWPAPDENESTR